MCKEIHSASRLLLWGQDSGITDLYTADAQGTGRY